MMMKIINKSQPTINKQQISFISSQTQTISHLISSKNNLRQTLNSWLNSNCNLLCYHHPPHQTYLFFLLKIDDLIRDGEMVRGGKRTRW